MADRLVLLGRNPTARKLAGNLGLTLPPTLKRDTGAWTERPLEGVEITVLLAPGAALAEPVARYLAEAGCSPSVGPEGVPEPFSRQAQAWGRPARPAAQAEAAHGIIVDATGLRTVDDLRALYTLLHERVGLLRSSGRVVLLSRPPGEADEVGEDTVEGAAVQRAVEGFMRSLAKELGRKGGTANQVVVPSGTEQRLPAVLRWLLSPRSAYVSGQPLHLSSTVREVEPRWSRPLDGKVALVTGGARGIGAATARALAREGARVVVLDRPGDEAEAARVAQEVGGVPLMVDLGAPDAPATVAAFLKEHFDGVDVVVHNAGVTRDKTLGRMSPEQWDLTLDVNLRAVLRLHQALSPLLRSHGRIVCLSSIAGLAGNVGQTNYAASKAAVAGFVAAAAPALGRRGIALNAVAPGFIETRMTAAIPVATREVARRLSNLSQGGLPADVAEAILFLSTPGACALSGQVLRVCGGSLVGA